MNLCPDERLLFVRMISAMLRRSGGDAGAVMFEAYRHIVSDTNQARRSCMLDLLESVRHDYVHGVSLDIENYCTVSLFFEQAYL